LATKLVELVDAAPNSVFHGDSLATVMSALALYALGTRLSADNSAMDLLAADAFVTYAFEAAAEEGGDVPALAQRILAEVKA
jgi:hypothetical protein